VQEASSKTEYSTELPDLCPATLWVLSSEFCVTSLDIRDHLDWLIDKLIPRKRKILELQHRDGVRMDVWCVWWSKYGEGGPALWPEQMGPLAELNLEWSIDVGFVKTTL
jgi:hypothetical protein